MTFTVACRLALVNLVMAAAAMPTATSRLQCCYDAAAGTLAVTAEPGEAALSRASEQHALFSALVSDGTGESSAAARRIKAVMPATRSLSSPVIPVLTAQSAAAAVPGAGVHGRSGAAYASFGTDSAGQQALRAAADSGRLLNPATLASVQQARQGAASNDLAGSGSCLTEHGSVPTAMDAFMPDQQSGQSVSAAGQPVASAAASMLYEVAWLASEQSMLAASPLPQAGSLHAVGDAAVHTGYGRHVLAAVDSRGHCSIRRLHAGRHAAFTAMSMLEALQRFTVDAATTAVRLQLHDVSAQRPNAGPVHQTHGNKLPALPVMQLWSG